MALEEDIRALSAVSLFSGLTREQLRLIAFGAENMRLAPGKTLYRQNAPADCAFVIVSGEVELVDTTGAQTRVLRTAGPGAILGEIALIAPTSRLTGAVASGNAEIIRINRSLFRRILEEYPAAARELQAYLRERLTNFNEDLKAARLMESAPAPGALN